MANKPKKKRNKQYRGIDAAITRPTVTRISAVKRSKLGQWWFDHKRVAKPIIIATLVVLAVIWLVIELLRIANAS
jgi:hypothetical protein